MPEATNKVVQEQLQEVLKQIDLAKQGQEESTKKLAELDAQRKRLEDLRKKLDPSIAAYAAQHPALSEARKKHDEWEKQLIKDVKYPTIAKHKDDNQAVIKAAIESRANLKLARETASEKKRAAEQALAGADKDVKQAEGRVNVWLDLVKTVQSDLGRLDKSRAAIDLDWRAERDALAFYRNEQAISFGTDTDSDEAASFNACQASLESHLIKPEELERRILDAFSELEKLRAAKSGAEAALKAASSDLDAAKQVFDDEAAQRTRDVEQRIGASQPKPAAPQPPIADRTARPLA